MPKPEPTDLIAAVYQAYSIIHPEADFEEIEAWDEALNAKETSSAVMEAYSMVCTVCLMKVLKDPELVDSSTLDIVLISVAAGYYEGASQMAKQLEGLTRIAKEALIGHSDPANDDLDELLKLLG